MISFTIPIQPISKKNSQRIVINSKTGRPFIIPSQKFTEYESIARWYIPQIRSPINRPVNVKCLFFMQSRRRCDLTNLLEAIDDVMVKAGLLMDDNYLVIRAHDGSRVFIDKEHPRTEVYISEME